MFGLGFGKLLLLVLVVVAVWYGFKFVGRLDRQRKGNLAARKRKSGEAVERMDQCRVCGTYVVAGQAANCGRPGCPY
jgi:uncharacterized protein